MLSRSDQQVCDLIESTFDSLFRLSEQTRLVGGFAEPEFIPAHGAMGRSTCAEVRYVYDHPRSALHECAHWCLAGAGRRGQIDFGYWYVPSNERSAEQQAAFERFEIRPQALESLFCAALEIPFQVSIDNLERGAADQVRFVECVLAEQAKIRPLVEGARGSFVDGRATKLLEALRKTRVSRQFAHGRAQRTRQRSATGGNAGCG